jgi:hypothetical protein
MYAKFSRKFQHYMDGCIIMTGKGEEDIHTATCHYLFEIFA